MDYRLAPLDKADRALCDFAIKLTLAPGAMSQHDVDALRVQGFSDEQITVAVQIIGYFNYINRVADGLGVDNEPWMDARNRNGWLRRKGRFTAADSQ